MVLVVVTYHFQPFVLIPYSKEAKIIEHKLLSQVFQSQKFHLSTLLKVKFFVYFSFVEKVLRDQLRFWHLCFFSFLLLGAFPPSVT